MRDSRLVPRFTKETASQAAIRGNLARWSRPRLPEPEPSLPVIEPEVAAAIADQFRERKVTRVRKQWDALDDLIDAETDPAKLDRLYSALARVEELDRRLTNRSLPPTLRANDKRGASRRPGSKPVLPKP